MKKIIKKLLVLTLVISAFITSALAVEWVFDDEATMNAWRYKNCSATLVDGGIKLAVRDVDINMSITLTSQGIKAEDYPIAVAVAKITSPSTGGCFFFTTSSLSDMGASNSEFNITADGTWNGYIVDISSLKPSGWKGTVAEFRLDLPNNAYDSSDDIVISRIGLFKNKEEAQAFIDADPAMADAAKQREEKEQALRDKFKDVDGIKFVFDSVDSISEWTTKNCVASYSFGFLCMTPTSWDPIMQYYFNEDTQFPASEFKYMALRLRPISTCNDGAFFFTNTVYPEFSDNNHIPFDVKNNEWNDIVVNMEEALPERWKGMVNAIRFDPINPSYLDGNAELYLDRAGFFRTEQEARDFLAGGRKDFDYEHQASIAKDSFKVIIPANSIKDTFDPDEYYLNGAADMEKAASAYVVRTDRDGNKKSVPMSYVNSVGYATYMATVPGKYEVAYANKEFTDVAGHWAEDNISFVANRELFGGTSPTEFSPDMTMTRGMFITVLGRMHDLDTSAYDGNTGYSDVNSSEYYAPYIQWATQEGLALPVSEGKFDPEGSITRKDMALIAANYMTKYNYSVKTKTSVEEFNDLDGLTDAEKAAVVSIQKAGIINGKREGKFDPYGISTRAEVAAVMQRIVKSILRVNILYDNYTNDYMTRDRIRIATWSYNLRPMAIDSTGRPAFVRLADLGIDTIVSMNGVTDEVYDLADQYGIEMFTGQMATLRERDQDSNPVKMNAEIADHPSFCGSYLYDEPGTDEYGWLSEYANDYIKKMPGKRPFINLLPMYANAAQLKYGAQAAAIEYYDADPDLYRNYCDLYCTMFDTDYICVDIYPLKTNGKEKYIYADYVESVNQVASSARDNGKEFWCCLQAHAFSNSMITPSVNDYLFQCYTLLSFGCRGLIWWYYEGNINVDALLHLETMEPTPAYYATQTVIAEIKKISDAYIQYDNLGAFTLNCSSTTPYLKMSNEYKDFDIISDITCDQPLLVGCFDKHEGDGHAFTLVNMSDLKDEKTATVKFKLAQDATVTSYQGGDATVITPVDGYYTVTLEWGAGAFFTIQ